ncbi:hypothetical protein O181_070279 [Austropuccinia psidii MF-1]|uniref:Uncharacterized protein n=1 Tax=Austropuccinia psidii MF-1 TaxID=1389203 RepID=A0A9Q3F0H5_9BASI|nr:hypothetical protein [Austropuccinia psidii MF-1]
MSSLPYSVPPPSPRPSTSRPILPSPIKSSPIPQPRTSPALTSHPLEPVASTSQRREYWSPFSSPASQLF